MNLVSSGLAAIIFSVPEPLIEARQVEKFYDQPSDNRIQVIAPLDLAIYPGENLTLLGPSGTEWINLPRQGNEFEKRRDGLHLRQRQY